MMLEFERLEAQLPQLISSYREASPFPHVVIDNFLPKNVALEASTQFPELDSRRWIGYVHTNENKFGNTDPATWGTVLKDILSDLNSDRFVKFLTELTGIDDLLIDESLQGGGLHQSITGGFLNVHADFTVHPHHRDWRRRINLLLYFNPDWRSEYGGGLELWDRQMKHCQQTIDPILNRAVIFSTDADSYHGHPTPLTCPIGTARRSLALYYFKMEDRPRIRSTEYRARPSDNAKTAISIFLDKQILRAYDRAKRRFGFSDQLASKLLARFETKRKSRRAASP